MDCNINDNTMFRERKINKKNFMITLTILDFSISSSLVTTVTWLLFKKFKLI